MNRNRPVNLNLFTIRFPLPAIISILHRISGFVLFLLIPFMLWGLSYSLTAEGFNNLQEWMSGFLFKFIFWALMAPLCFHLIAGLRHLLMDIHIGSTLRGARKSALITLIVSIIIIILAGIWVW